jgi:hypothetical protein
VGIHGTLTCGQVYPYTVGIHNRVGIGGASVSLSGALSKSVTTNGNGDFDTSVNLGPSTTSYSVNAHYAGDSTHEPADAVTGFSITEKRTSHLTD